MLVLIGYDIFGMQVFADYNMLLNNMGYAEIENGSSVVTPSIPANPDMVFESGDFVFVHYINRNPNNLFVPYKRAVTIGI
jgi:hypothetical protein